MDSIRSLEDFGISLITKFDPIDIVVRMKEESIRLGMEEDDFNAVYENILLGIETQFKNRMSLVIPEREDKIRPETITKIMEKRGYKFVYTLTPNHFHIYDSKSGTWIDEGHSLDNCHRIRSIGRDIYRKCAFDDYGYAGKEPKNHFLKEFLIHVRDKTFVKHNEFFPVNTNTIPVKNGVLNLGTMELLPHSPDHRILSTLNVEYDPEATCPTIEWFFDDLIDRGIITEIDKQGIFEFFGYCLTFDRKFERYLMLIGKPGSGKSLCMLLLEELLGISLLSAETLQSLENDKFAVANLEGKLANMCADLPEKTLDEVPVLKKFVSGDTMQAERKFEQSYPFKPRCKLIFSSNNPPTIRSDDNAFWRRLLLVHFKGNIPKEVRDGSLKEKLIAPEELSGFLNLLLQARAELYERGHFINDIGDEEVGELYSRLSDPVSIFVQECFIKVPGKCVVKDDAYDLYVKWCDAQHITPKKSNDFKGEVTKKFKEEFESDRKTIGSDRVGVWNDGILITESMMLKKIDKK